MRVTLAAVLGLLALDATGPARAEAPEEPVTRVSFNLAASMTFPLGPLGQRIKRGEGLQVGLGYSFTDWLTVQAEYFHSGYEVEANVLDANNVEGDHALRMGNISALVRVVRLGDFSAYLVGGPGLYYRRVDLSKVQGVSFSAFCDPLLFFCFSQPVPVEETLRSKSITNFGLGGGVGVTWRYAGPLQVYLEARYHYIFGPTFETPTGPRKADGQYLPVVLGVRF
ncbi:outer membrane beta-barrel protein [Myxococcaceae bacterium GXIMD 01537]